MTKPNSFLAVILGSALALQGADHSLHTFRKLQLSDQFWSEGAYVGDFNKDGSLDVVSGPFWWEGPSFQTKHEYRPATQVSKVQDKNGRETTVPGFAGALGNRNEYSDNFFTFAHDLNGDGWDDVLIVGLPGQEAFWFENSRGGSGHWRRYVALDVVENESPTWLDLTGDGRPEILCNAGGYIGYASPDWSQPTSKWIWHAITPKGDWHRYSHGLGAGDVNGDGRLDVLDKDGWWEQPSSLAGDPVWKRHPASFGGGGAQMYVYDVNGDTLNDVISCLAAHGYGLAWFEQYREGEAIKFRQHTFMNEKAEENRYGVHFSQPHALDLVDMDKDGLKDIVVGKRFWAHGPTGDPEPNAPALLYWFKLTRDAPRGVDFVPHLIDDDSGVGTEVLARDVNGDGWPDVVVGNKKGTFVHLQQVRKVSEGEWEQAQPKPVH